MARKQGENVQVVRAREEQAWQLRAQGWTQVRISEHLEIDQSTASKALARVQVRRLAELKELVDQERTLQHCRLDYLYDQAMQAWERSKTRPRKRKPEEGEGAAPEASPELREGNPRLLAEARGILADLRKLWGLDAPSKHLIGASTGADLGKGERDEILRQLGLLPPEPRESRKGTQNKEELEPPGEPPPTEPAPIPRHVDSSPPWDGDRPLPPLPDGLGYALDELARTLPPTEPKQSDAPHP